MKNILLKLASSGIAAGMVLAFSQFACGQTVETTTTTTSNGTITQFDPNAIVVKSETSTEPIRYEYTKKTVYVDENGNPVSIETIKSGLPVTVYYDREGNEMVATKVIVRKAVAVNPAPAPAGEETTTTTTTAGTVSSLGAQDIVVKTESSPEPIRYRFTKTTTYVDENGNPVSIETVKEGAPVTVYYERQGDEMIARRVIVRQAPGAVIEHKKTTTTTTEER